MADEESRPLTPDARFFAEPALSKVEGLRMTEAVVVVLLPLIGLVSIIIAVMMSRRSEPTA